MYMNRPVRVLLAGNPNVGKSTVFNCLTGLRQHTGNWPGKTVETAEGQYRYKGREYRLVDLPGTYSLDARSGEEQVAREALERRDYDCVAVVCDGTMLRRNLILVYQILALEVPVVVCVNLMDEAERKGITVDSGKLSRLLGTAVIETAAGRNRGIEGLRERIRAAAEGFSPSAPPELPAGRRERAAMAAKTAQQVTKSAGRTGKGRADRILTGKWTGLPVMVLLLFALLWLTVAGANVPSELIWRGIRRGYEILSRWCAGWPWWLRGALLDGVLLTAGRVVAVMLPPMAIFFPLFTLLEDLGYLPRMAYNLDRPMACCGGCGKMALTMCMGLGCNAAGVTGCRIIDSPRERLLAVLTNSFIPCNGRFGALILLMTVCLPTGMAGSAGAALGLTLFLILGVLAAMGVCRVLSATILRGMPSAFVLELPPFRMPRVGQVLIRSVLDRTLKVLGRAAGTAAPAGLILWVLTAVPLGEGSLLRGLAARAEPAGRFLGMNGALLVAFVLGWPANEIVLPVAALAVSGALELGNPALGPEILGMDWRMALCTAVFFLFHWPCATTCLTIRKETGSVKWTLLAAALPTGVGILLCAVLRVLLGLL